MTMLLGGTAAPLGESIQFVRADADSVIEAAVAVHRAGLGDVLVEQPFVLTEGLSRLLPFEAPWTRELIMACGPHWTAYLNNFVNGGDSSAIGAAIARMLGVDHVVAMNNQRPGAVMQSTRLWFHGHDGTVRNVAAYCADRRWSWHEHGDPLPFEDVDRYAARLTRQRLDRELLLDYLDALQITIRRDDIYGPGTVVRQIVPWDRRTVSWAQARQEMALDDRWPPQP